MTAVQHRTTLPRCPASTLVVTHRLDGGASARSIDRDFARGNLVRVARGVYTDAERWLRTTPWDRHLIALVGLSMSRTHPPVFVGASAALAHGLPMTTTPSALHLRARSRGASGRSKRPSPYGDRQAVETLRRTLATTHQVPQRLPDLPDIQGHWNLPSHPDLAPQPVHVTLSDGSFLGTVLADPAPVALAVIMRTGDLQLAVPPLDAYLRANPRTGPTTLATLRSALPSHAQKQRFDTVLALSDPRAESPGESLSRVVIHQLGFDLPTPQVEIRDATGRLIARVDGLWEAIGLVGEFDGLTKYSGTFTGSTPPSEIVVAEKLREDQLRRAGHDVARWTWADLRTPGRLERILTQHQAPRRPR